MKTPLILLLVLCSGCRFGSEAIPIVCSTLVYCRIRVQGVCAVYLARQTGACAMKFCRLWMLPVMLPVCGTIGCGEAPETVVEKPETAAREPKPSDSEREVADKPKA
jgi:hypothetical protein